MASYVLIANLAASKIGETDRIRSVDEDSNLGRCIASVWEMTRQAALRDHTWNFATKRAALAASATFTAIEWGYAYPVPADNLRILGLLDWPGKHQYQLEGAFLLSDHAGPLRIRYIADIAEPAYWDALFAEAFACRLAYEIADTITGDAGRRDAVWKAYLAALSQAKRVDARENPGVEQEPGDWELARMSFGSRICVPFSGPYQ